MELHEIESWVEDFEERGEAGVREALESGRYGLDTSKRVVYANIWLRNRQRHRDPKVQG